MDLGNFTEQNDYPKLLMKGSKCIQWPEERIGCSEGREPSMVTALTACMDHDEGSFLIT